MASCSSRSIALVADPLGTQGMGGAERVFNRIIQLFPTADVYVPFLDRKRLPMPLQTWPIQTSWINRTSLVRQMPSSFFPLLPGFFESFDLQAYDLVLSFHHFAAKSVITRPDAMHICYCYTPARYLWDQYPVYIGQLKGFQKYGLMMTAKILRQIDLKSVIGVNQYVTISHWVKERIQKYYRQSALVIPPPVELNRFYNQPAEDYYLAMGRLEPYKRFDLVIEAFNELKRPLKVIGTGSQYGRLKRMAGSYVTFLGAVSDEQAAEWMSRCCGFVFAGVEDFGLVMAEAQAAGKPVIAYQQGGAVDIVIPEETGLFFSEPTVLSLKSKILLADNFVWNAQTIQKNAQRFDLIHFERQFLACVEDQMRDKTLSHSNG